MSEIKTDKLTGVGTASTITIANNEIVGASSGNITIPGEGGTTKTNLQQGLAKTWVNFNGTGTVAIRDSLNVSGLTDNGTGDQTVHIGNDMGNNFYAITSHTQRNASTTENSYCSSFQNNYDTAHATGSFRVHAGRPDVASHEDALAVMLSVLGDLA